MSVFTGKFDFSPYASNENMFVVLKDGWVERGQVFVFSTFTKDASGVDKRPFDLTTAYVLQAEDASAKTFTIRDLNKKAFYWFHGTRNEDGTITLELHSPNSFDKSTIKLTKLA